MISMRNVVLRRGPHVLLEEVNWTIYPKQHIGVIGQNGSGKSSLFSLFLGGVHADSGEVEMSPQLKIAHVAQETPGLSISALAFVLEGDERLCELECALREAEAKEDGHQIAVIHAELQDIDAYRAPSRAAQLLDGLGFSHEEQHKPVSAFSGGWRVRLNLAKALMCRSDVLLLDEPTNHLDLDAVLWLETWLMRYPGTLLLISHDRDFLDRTVGFIAHLSHQRLKVYTGNYSAFEKIHAEQLLLQQSAYEKQQKQIAHMKSFIDRFKAKASKASQAQSRMKALDRMELISAVQTESPFEFCFKEPKKCPNPLLTLDDGVIAYGDHIVLRHLNLSLTPKDRIALLGQNGAGKSSLIKLLAGKIMPKTGYLTLGSGLQIGYFAQHQVDALNLEETPLAHMQELSPDSKDQVLRTYLGTFGFSGTRVLESIGHFSGGEKARLALALLIWRQPNLLLLDEPTNHLDLEVRQALSLALQEYTGAMILVSHDRFLVRSTVDQLMLVHDGSVAPFEGDLDDYQTWILNLKKQQDKAAGAKKESRQSEIKRRDLEHQLEIKIKKLEMQLTSLQNDAKKIETSLSDTTLYLDQQRKEWQQHMDKQRSIQSELKQLEQEWLTACHELDTLRALK